MRCRAKNKICGISISCSQEEKAMFNDLVIKSGSKTGSEYFTRLIRELTQGAKNNFFPKLEKSERTKNLLENFKAKKVEK